MKQIKRINLEKNYVKENGEMEQKTQKTEK